MRDANEKLKTELCQIIEKIENDDYTYLFFMYSYPEFTKLIKEAARSVIGSNSINIDEIFILISAPNNFDFDGIKKDIQCLISSSKGGKTDEITQKISNERDIYEIYSNIVDNYDTFRHYIYKAITTNINLKRLKSERKSLIKMRAVDFRKHMQKVLNQCKLIIKKAIFDKEITNFFESLKPIHLLRVIELILRIENWIVFIIWLISKITGNPLKTNPTIKDDRDFIKKYLQPYPYLSRFF